MSEVGLTTELAAVEVALRAACARLDPDVVPAAAAPPLWALLDAVERLAAGAKVRLARRVETSGVGGRGGELGAARWMAQRSGTSVGQAAAQLAASTRVARLAGTDAALASGVLSAAQAVVVSDAAASSPADEARLLDAARTASLVDLREECARPKAATEPDLAARERRIHVARSLRTFTDAEGAWNLHARTTTAQGARIQAALAPYIEAEFERARVEGRREPREAYAMDALHAMATAEPATRRSRRPDAKVIVLIDHAALTRGATEPGERCEIAGVGPVSVATARSMLGEATLAAVVTDGVDVYSVAHLGRQVTAHQRTALEARGYRCEVPECGSSSGLQIDHITGWALNHRTQLDDLCWLCPHHHRQKTHDGHRIVGPPRQRRWLAPPGATSQVA